MCMKMACSKRSHDFTDSGSKKRKHVSLTIMKKVEILKKLDSGSTPNYIAETYGIAVRTVYDIRKNRQKLLEFYCKSDTNAGIQNRKTLHEAKSTDLDTILFEWFKQRRNDGIPISGPILREKAKQLHADLKIKEACNFTGCWLHRFKQRHGIRYIKACGEKLSADSQAAEEFIEEFSLKVSSENITPEQVFNMDETGLFWRCLPRKTFVCSQESAVSSVKEAKERVTVLLCSNATGTYQCKPLVVGKSAHPRALKCIKTLPVIYKNNKRAWMTKEIMTEWFMNHFVKGARRHCSSIGLPTDCKILLLLDNCTAHSNAVLSSDNIEVLFLPPNTTALIQPMDQGIIQSLKCHYKSQFLQKILRTDPSLSLRDYKFFFTIRDCIYLLAESWNSISRSTLVNGWHNIWPSTLFIETEADAAEFPGFRMNAVKEMAKDLLLFAKKAIRGEESFEENEIVSWLTNPDERSTNKYEMTDEEIISSVLNKTQENSDGDDDAQLENSKKILFDEGLILGENYLKFLEQQNCVTEQELMTIYILQKKLKLEQPKVLKQKTLKEMFTKM